MLTIRRSFFFQTIQEGFEVRTYNPTNESIKRDWHIIDLEGKNLGRTASAIARVLAGKHKPTYSNHLDHGDFVVVINAGKFSVTGNKMTDKRYVRHSTYPGGYREDTMRDILQKFPHRLIQMAVKGMLPKNRLRSRRIKRLKIYTTGQHPHLAQKPVELTIQ
jgi:large subunit ribosomal protein L13